MLRYFWRLGWSVYAPARPSGRRLGAVAAVPAVVVLLIAVMAALRAPASALGASAGYEQRTRTDALIDRTQGVNAVFTQVESLYRDEIEPLERVLLYYNTDERLVRRVASALVGEGRRAGIAPEILLAVLLVENPDIDPGATSFVGARGLMQVMPLHRGNWRQCDRNMDTIEGNICYGAQIFRSNLQATNGNIEKALLRYNGCVRGTNTPNCGQYPYHVFARAGKAAFITKQANRSGP
jgi:soluble lytic murein transglycosylase-like protein